MFEGARTPLARLENDIGAVDGSTVIPYITITFRRTADQDANLNALLAAQQDRTSPQFHAWLTPEQFAERFGLDQGRLNAVRVWLASNGFSIKAVARSRTSISFSGTAGQVESVFHAVLHRYLVNGESHFAPATDLQVPAALAKLVSGLHGLDDFYPKPAGGDARARPDENGGSGSNYLAPDDFAIIYNIAPLYAAGIDGSGQTIAVVGDSDFDDNDIRDYRAMFHLPASDPVRIPVPGVGETGFTGGQGEATLDLEISGGVARGAQLLFVYAPDVVNAMEYAIDGHVAPIMSVSFHACEANLSPNDGDLLGNLGKLAAATGVTWVNSAGDSGPADCDAHGGPNSSAAHGLSVNAFAAVPQATAVGGTEFAADPSKDNGVDLPEDPSTYWLGGNSGNLSSATMYIPEVAWNDSGRANGILASGGGLSRLFQTPSWQEILGAITENRRAVPDIALSSSYLHDAYADCYKRSCANGRIDGGGGTSAATPAFAGVAALLSQYLQASAGYQSGLGTLNPTLYALNTAYASQPTSLIPFHDVQYGSNIIPCEIGTANCLSGSFGYSAAVGYDLVTGLGSIDADQLFTAWLKYLKPQQLATATTMGMGMNSIPVGGAATLTVTVKATEGTPASPPTGQVNVTLGSVRIGSGMLTPGSSSSVAVIQVLSAALLPGTNKVTIRYAGDGTFLASELKTSLILDTMASPALKGFVVSSTNPTIRPGLIYEEGGSSGRWNYRIVVRETQGGTATLTKVLANGVDLTAKYLPLFSSAVLPRFGSITASVSDLAISPPQLVNFEVDAKDASGNVYSTTFTALFLGNEGQASMVLTGIPRAVVRNAGAPANCQWEQQLTLQEVAGTAVALNHFNTGMMDQSLNIANFWGSTELPANGTLTAYVCFVNPPVPTLVDFQVTGTDAVGNTVVAALSVPYLGASASPNTLAISPPSVTLANRIPALITVTASGAKQVWTVTIRYSGASGWLALDHYSGVGSTPVIATATQGTLASGSYSATLFFESLDAVPQVIPVPVSVTF